MPRRKLISTTLDLTIDDRLDQLAVMRFGHPQATQDLRSDYIASNPVQRFPIVEAAQELAAMIRTAGVQRPLWVRPHPDKARRYELLFAPHRWQAASFAGFNRIPCVVVEADNRTVDEFGLMEELQRMAHPLFDEAEMLRWMLDTGHFTIRSLAAQLGRKKGYLENRLALLDLPTDLQELVAAQPETLSAALLLAKVADAEMQTALLSGVRNGLITVEAIRAEIRALERKDLVERLVTVDTLPDLPGMDTLPPDQAETNLASMAAMLRLLPGEASIQAILMRWKALRKDETIRQNVDAALTRMLALIAEIKEIT